MQAEQQPQLRRRNAHNTADKHLLELVARFADDNQRHHQNQAGQRGRQIHLPMLHFFQPHAHQSKRQRHKKRHLRRMQRKNAEIEPQKLSIGQHFADAGGLRLGIFMQLGLLRIGRYPRHHGNADQGKHTGEHKQTAHADQA